MTHYDRSMIEDDRFGNAVNQALGRIAEPGEWFTGAERAALARVARMAFGERHLPPWRREQTGAAAASSAVGEDTARLMVTLTVDAARIDRAWATSAIATIGDGAYVELVAIAATVAIIDAFAEATGAGVPPFLSPLRGEPTHQTPEGMADIGAYVPMQDPWPNANVGRALTINPSGNALYRGIATVFYHDGDFLDLQWDHAITRPQAELVATTIAAASECFY
jgi:hypothetical protein